MQSDTRASPIRGLWAGLPHRAVSARFARSATAPPRGEPPAYWTLLLGMLFCYAALTQTITLWLLKRFWLS